MAGYVMKMNILASIINQCGQKNCLLKSATKQMLTVVHYTKRMFHTRQNHIDKIKIHE